MTLKKGTLWQAIVKTTEQALQSGALFPVPTDYTFLEDSGVRFFIRVLASLERKVEARKKQEEASRKGKTINPFLPPEKKLTVADVSDTHIAVLNKFNVVEHHLLIITREFEDQDMLLSLKDFEALLLCMNEYDSLGFYNGGSEAGASQQHKHLQLVPLPLAPEGPAVPLEPLIAAANVKGAGVTTLPGLPFLHSFVRLAPDFMNASLAAAQEAFGIYSAMLQHAGMRAPDKDGPARHSMPYCFLMTRDWMLLVPRSGEFFSEISLNSLSFAGSLFVRDAGQLEQLRAFGPMNALKSVTLRKE